MSGVQRRHGRLAVTMARKGAPIGAASRRLTGQMVATPHRPAFSPTCRRRQIVDITHEKAKDRRRIYINAALEWAGRIRRNRPAPCSRRS